MSKQSQLSEQSFTGNLLSNRDMIMNRIGHNSDVVVRDFYSDAMGTQVMIIYIHCLVDKGTINNQVIRALQQGQAHTPHQSAAADQGTNPKERLQQIIQLGRMNAVRTLAECIDEILSGQTALFTEGMEEAILLGTCSWKTRSIEEPVTESVVRGPREGFVEDLETNVSLLRRRIRNPDFSMINYHIGRQTRRNLVIVYLSNITNPLLVKEVQRRIELIDIDDAPESGFIEQLIEDNPWSPFPQIQNTERIDKVIASLLEGRVAILLDGTPFVLLAPVTFPMLLQAPEDYYDRWFVGSLIRMLRYLLVIAGLFLPSLYIALVSYHQGLIPSKLAISITSSREGVPFPTIIEALLMEITIEVLREAGIRLPKPIGQAVGIVGGLVIGQSAVQAGIVSPIMVIIVSFTAISSFAIPSYSVAIAIRILRFTMMVAASVLGLYGMVLALLLICSHVVKLKSFGVNYMGAFVHSKSSDWKDTFLRLPIFMMKRRPHFLRAKNQKRQS
ncbi:spore germination protein [Brevibacillus migulae]|uniref:spore germination protein n=1 Tax=Brevibacillus migulae TaxID=1644114 RepID=UPI00106EA0E4|nr:spore germination protein [Brevibacillus migulae]